MKNDFTIWLILLLAFVSVSSCSETKTLEPGQYLYNGAEIKIKSEGNVSGKQERKLKSELLDLLRPKPNSSFLGIRYKLLIYNLAAEPKRKGLSYWLRNKVGEPPVLASMSAFEKNRTVLQNHLENRGFFKDSVILDTMAPKRKMTAIYTALLGPQYRIRNVSYPDDSSELSQQIQKIVSRPLLKKGDPYDLNRIKNERERIDQRLKQRGYYYFNPDYLLARVDSTVGDHLVDLSLVIKRSTPAKAKNVYYIHDITVYTDYHMGADTSRDKLNAEKKNGYRIVDPDQKFRPSLFYNTLVFHEGDIYNRRDHDLSLNRLVNLGVFKFVKIRFEEADSLAGNKLNTFYYLTPTEKKSIRFEVSALTKSNSSNGGELGVTWRNRNLFRGAELFTVNVYGGIERQYFGTDQIVRTNKVGTDINLYFPRIIPALKLHNNSAFVPKTRLNLGYEFFQRTSEYALNSVKISYGYVWKQNVQKEHQLTLLTINYVKPSQITPAFQMELDTNLTLARSIEKQFIIGPSYNFNLNTLLKNNRRPNNYFFNANLDLSANLIGILSGANVATGNEKKILNTPFSQYIRGELDFRHYLSLSNNSVLVSRITGGLGYSYGNSLTMPFIKEFFAGGANDLRAFRSRSLGPGSYYAGNRDTAFLPDQPGDIKIEMNAEWRFKLFSVFRWAFFVDAGNIWTLRTDSSRPGSTFSNQFLQQIAVGVGTGLRLDISILILRLDLAVPVREPFLPAGQRWGFDYRNMVWNFAIGYPF